MAHSISFDEKMSGPLAWGETDPVRGEENGKISASVFTMHASIFVDDLEKFQNDHNHTGRLEATVDFTPFGNGIRTSGGVFNLFTAPDATGLKNMVYAFNLRHENQDYYFYGHKNVRNDAFGLDLWKDTTTLHSTLHRGTDRSGPVVAAGVLSLGLADLLKLVSTMKPVGGSSLSESASAIARFGRIFMGELWDTYARKR
jgi:cholesterol oxidase